MSKLINTLFLFIGIYTITGCASIVSKNSYPIAINSNPIRANVVITDSNGIEVYKGITPATFRLKSKEGFFKRASYEIKISADGYDERVVPVQFKVDGWYWGNLIFGGLIGFLIVDPATGSMYKLETELVYETLTESNASSARSELRILDLNQIPEVWKSHLIKVATTKEP